MEAARLAKMGFKSKLEDCLSNKNQNPKRWIKVAHNKNIIMGRRAL